MYVLIEAVTINDPSIKDCENKGLLCMGFAQGADAKTIIII